MFSRFMMTLPVFIGQFFKFALIVAFIGAASHYVGQLLPRRNFDYDAVPYAPRKWEQDGMFYLPAERPDRQGDALPAGGHQHAL
jgi:hypothetical protein